MRAKPHGVLGMIVESLALAAAFFYGLNSVLVRMGMARDAKSNPFSASIITMFADLIFMWAIYIAISPPFIIEAAWVFAAAGIIAQVFARTLNYTGIHRLGVSVSTPISGANPVFAAITASILLSEIMLPQTYVGIALVVCGVAVVSLGSRELDLAGHWKKRDLIIPLSASVCYGLAATVRKVGLNILNVPVAGASLGILTAFSIYAIFLLLSGKIKTVAVNRLSSPFFMAAGFSTALAWICNFTALSMGRVSIVAPIQSTSPLVSLFLCRIFLRDCEKLTAKVIVGAVAVVLGIVVISLFK